MKTLVRLVSLSVLAVCAAPGARAQSCPSITNAVKVGVPYSLGGFAGGTYTRCVRNNGSDVFGAFDLVLSPGANNYYTGYSGPGNALVTPYKIQVTGVHVPPGTVIQLDVTAAGTWVQSFTDFIAWGLAQAYCTAGVSASGCQAALTASGTPSATAASGFTLTASGVEGDKDGIFFFGANGRQANPWGNGTSFQCVVPPVKRGGVLTGAGTPGACDGAFQQDLNALWTASPNKNPGEGAVVQAQLWYRDPASTSNQTTSLSHAVEFTVCP